MKTLRGQLWVRILQLQITGDRTAADVLANLRKRLIDASQAVTRPDGIPKSETVCLHDESKAAGFRQLVTSKGVRRHLVRDGGAIRAETASAAITGLDEARGMLSAVRHPS